MGKQLEKKFGIGNGNFGLGLFYEPLSEATQRRDNILNKIKIMDKFTGHNETRNKQIEQMRYLVIGMLRIVLPSKRIN